MYHSSAPDDWIDPMKRVGLNLDAMHTYLHGFWIQAISWIITVIL